MSHGTESTLAVNRCRTLDSSTEIANEDTVADEIVFPDAPPLKYSLLTNGVDFIVAGVEAAFGRHNYEANRYKYAILHVFAGVLLVLKERLRREHASLIFDKVETVGDDSARTVDFAALIRRLQKIAGVKFNDAQLDTLQRAQVKRNRIEHYEVELDVEEAQILINELVEFSYAFLRDELQTDLRELVSPTAWNEVRELDSIVQRLEASGEVVWRCVRCNQRLYSRKAFCGDCTSYIAQSHT